MKLFEKVKKLIRDSNPMNKKETLVEKCLKGKCSNIEKQIEFMIQEFSTEQDLKNELGLTDDEYEKFIESDALYDAFKEILIDRVISKK